MGEFPAAAAILYVYSSELPPCQADLRDKLRKTDLDTSEHEKEKVRGGLGCCHGKTILHFWRLQTRQRQE